MTAREILLAKLATMAANRATNQELIDTLSLIDKLDKIDRTEIELIRQVKNTQVAGATDGECLEDIEEMVRLIKGIASDAGRRLIE